jgi:hypothetical protein
MDRRNAIFGILSGVGSCLFAKTSYNKNEINDGKGILVLDKFGILNGPSVVKLKAKYIKWKRFDIVKKICERIEYPYSACLFDHLQEYTADIGLNDYVYMRYRRFYV